jgi:hypothetical protein
MVNGTTRCGRVEIVNLFVNGSLGSDGDRLCWLPHFGRSEHRRLQPLSAPEGRCTCKKMLVFVYDCVQTTSQGSSRLEPKSGIERDAMGTFTEVRENPHKSPAEPGVRPRHQGKLVEALPKAKSNVAVAQGPAEPARMDLVPILGVDGTVTDFAWRLANSNSARILGCGFYGVYSPSLANLCVDEARRAVLFATYVCALSTQSLQYIRLKGERHSVWPAEGGLKVFITAARPLPRIA